MIVMKSTKEEEAMSEQKMISWEHFKYYWFLHISIWCVKRQAFLHKLAPVVINPGTNNEQVVEIKPKECFRCKQNIINGGICDPL